MTTDKMMKVVVFLFFAFFALMVSANDYGDDDYGKDVNKYYPQDQKGNFKNGVFLISSKCTRSCNSDCGNSQILQDKAKIDSRFAPRLAAVLKGTCNYDGTKGCGCYVPSDDDCAQVYTCGTVEYNGGKCRPKPVLSPQSDRPCSCPRTCDTKSTSRTRLSKPDRTRLDNPNGIQPDRTRLMSVDGCPPDGSQDC
ncbi:hypothetical protein HDK77DRAFT_434223 [Phyllosticta capitalensis]